METPLEIKRLHIFMPVFEKALINKVFSDSTEFNDQYKALMRTTFGLPFFKWLEENYDRDLKKLDEFSDACTYNNFVNFYKEKYPRPRYYKLKALFWDFNSWLKKDEGYGNLKWIIGMLVGFFTGLVSKEFFLQLFSKSLE